MTWSHNTLNPQLVNGDAFFYAGKSFRKVILGVWKAMWVYPRAMADHSSTERMYFVNRIWVYMPCIHYGDVIMGAIASQITSLTIVYSTVYSDADQIKHESSASLAFVRGIHRGPVKSPHKWPVTRKMFPYDNVIISSRCSNSVIENLNHTLIWTMCEE